MPVREIARKGYAAKVDALQEAAEDAVIRVDAVAVVAAIATAVAGAAGIKQNDW
jgi:hypothetical protein